MKLEYTIISVYGGAAWIITRPAGDTTGGTTAYKAVTKAMADRRIDKYRRNRPTGDLGAPLTGDDVSREWNTYCEHHYWNQKPHQPTTWKWRAL